MTVLLSEQVGTLNKANLLPNGVNKAAVISLDAQIRCYRTSI